MRRKLINKGFSRGSLRFTTGKNSGRINKNDFAPQNGLRTRCLWALAETGFENSPILEGNKPSRGFSTRTMSYPVREQPDPDSRN